MQEKLSPWKRFVNLLKLDRQDILQLCYYAIFSGLVALTLPLGIQAIINLMQSAQVSTSWIVLVILVTLGVAFQGVLQLMQIRILERMQQKIFTRASFEFAYRFPKIKMEELHNLYPPELANRFFDVLTVQKGLSKILIDFPTAILQIVLGLIVLSFYHPFFILYGLLLMFLIYIAFKFTAKKGLETSLVESKSKYKVAHWIQEIARSLIGFKSSGSTSFSMDKNDELTSNYLEARENHFRVLMYQFIQMIGFKVLVTAGLLIIGGLLVLNQRMNIGQFVASEIIILLVMNSVEKLTKGLESFYDVLTSLEKIGQVVDKDLESQAGEIPFLNDKDVRIELKKLSYVNSNDKLILDEIDLEISRNDNIIFQGISGSGKSVILKIISGLISPSQGELYINDISIRGVWLNHYRAQIGQVLPEELPFEGTILENITLGKKEISKKQLHEILKEIGLSSFVKEQKNGLNTVISSGGRELPLTVIKRIILARAIISQPKILLIKGLLDSFEEKEALPIITYLTSDERPWLLITSSQHYLWKKYCNRIVRFNNGKITLNTNINA